MGNSWYRKSMPKVGTIKPYLDDMSRHVASIAGVESVLVWGSFAKNASNPNFVVKDIDLIAVTDIFSEDLISITNDKINSPFNLTTAQLEEDGFDPKAVKFTKQFIKMKDYNIDHWAISNDNKLLHWGAMIETKEDWDALKQKAEEFAEKTTKISRKKLSHLKQASKDKWAIRYDHFINKYLSDMPEGWYESNCVIEDVLKETKKIV